MASLDDLPEFVHFMDFTWHVVPKNRTTVVLHMIGFQNQETLTWGRSAMRLALSTGGMKAVSNPKENTDAG